MKSAILRDIHGKKEHNLIKLAEENDDEISVGREGSGNLIELGQDTTISRKHATITYLNIGKFCIRDHSTNGTRINNTIMRAEAGCLRDGDELWFGAYGPVFYVEVYSK